MDKVTRLSTNHSLFEEKGEPKRNRTEAEPARFRNRAEARWLIRDGNRVGRGRKSEGSTADTARKRPERLWTSADDDELMLNVLRCHLTY